VVEQTADVERKCYEIAETHKKLFEQESVLSIVTRCECIFH
jgi:hypothetical protein